MDRVLAKSRSLDPLGTATVLLGTAAVISGFTVLPWIPYLWTTLSFGQVGEPVIRAGVPALNAYQSAYFHWLGLTLLVVAPLTSLIAIVPSRLRPQLRVAGTLLGVGGLLATFFSVPDIGSFDLLLSGTTGWYLTMIGFLTLALGTRVVTRDPQTQVPTVSGRSADDFAINPVGLLIIALGAATVGIGFGALPWVGSNDVPFANIWLSFAQLGVGVTGNTDAYHYALAYFHGLWIILLVAASIAALLANLPTHLHQRLRAIGALVSFGALVATFFSLPAVYGGFGVLSQTPTGWYVTMAGFLVIGLGATLGPRRCSSS